MKFIVTTALILFANSVFAEGISDQVSEQLANPKSFEERINALNSETIYSQSCCKRCRKGKACGNSCISRSYTCRKGKGCACD